MRVRSLVSVMLLLASAPAAAVVLTGSVRTDGAQDIFTPPSMSSPVVLHFYLPDGTRVKKGQPVLRIDASSAASQLRSLRDSIEQTRATNAKDLAALQLKQVDAELALVDAVAARDTAAVDAAIPKRLLAALDYDRYQGTWESTRRDAALKQQDLDAARAAVARQRKDGALKVEKARAELAFMQAQVDAATVVATRDGMLVHAFQDNNPWGDGGRYQQGSTSFPGTRVGQVVGSGRHSVRAWALQPDRAGLKVGQAVRVYFDALPGVASGGHIRAISGATAAKPEWGAGRYYKIDIALDAAAAKLPLLPGMSVRVQTDTDGEAPAPVGRDTRTAVIHATGEVFAQRTLAVMPPQVQGLWQMNVTQMAADGAPVKKGQPLVTFAAGNLAQKLPAKRSELAEKQRAQDQLRLKLADDARSATLATAQARADANKARRKAEQPEEYVPGIEYKKLVIDRRRTAERLALTQKRETVAAASRKAQQRLADAQVEQLQREVAQMQKSLASLTVKAPRDGLFLHKVMSDGDKIDTGSQVWRGMSVGDMPDMHSLAVRADLPERDLRRVHEGQAVRVVLSGGASRTLDGRIKRIGHSVHSKSSAEPVPVVDLLIQLKGGAGGLKPGRPVRVDIVPTREAP